MKIIYFFPLFIIPFLNCNNDYTGVQSSKDLGDLGLVLGSVQMSFSGGNHHFNTQPANYHDNLEIYHSTSTYGQIVIKGLHDSLCIMADVNSDSISFNQSTDLFPQDLGFNTVIANWLPVEIQGEGKIESFNGKKSKLTLSYNIVHFGVILATYSGSRELTLPRPYWWTGSC